MAQRKEIRERVCCCPPKHCHSHSLLFSSDAVCPLARRRCRQRATRLFEAAIRVGCRRPIPWDLADRVAHAFLWTTFIWLDLLLYHGACRRCALGGVPLLLHALVQRRRVAVDEDSITRDDRGNEDVLRRSSQTM